MKYQHDADSHMTKGTAKVIIDMVNGETRDEVAELNLESFVPLGIKELLTMQRQIGFASLIERVVGIARNG
jgi:sulfur transfer protein SufE